MVATHADVIMGAMTSLRTTPHRALVVALATLVLAAIFPIARAQDLARLLPADTAFALGAVDLDAAADLLQPLADPWTELGVGEALAAVLGGSDLGALAGAATGADLDGEALGDALPPELVDVDLLALLGGETWVGVSVSPFNPLPALTLLALVDDDLGARFDAVLARAALEPDALALNEGDVGFVVVPLEGGFPLAAVRHGELLALSTNPDVLRGVLRQLQGSDEPGFLDAPGVVATFGTLAAGELVGFLDLGPLARALAPLTSGLGFDRSVDRLAAALETIGAYAGVTRLSEDGTHTTTLRRLDGAGRDPALRALLSGAGAAPRELLAWVPDDALSVQVTALDPAAWWDYLRDLVEGLTELGVADLDRTVRDLSGVDPVADVLAWTAPGLAIVQTGVGEVAPVGAPSDDLLGESVLVLRARDAAAAEAGLGRALDALAQRAVLFADPFAEPGANGTVVVRERVVGATTVRLYDVVPGVTLATAVTSDAAGAVALIGTTEAGVVAVLEAAAAGVALPSAFDALLGEVPGDANAFVLTDDRATLANTGALLGQQVQLLAGFAGGGIDFAAVENATAAIDAYLAAIAPRFGGSVSWSRSTADGATEGAETSRIDLR
ncbi:MAG: hypothetical protein P1P87_06495 [Trueperaceae bacterium]|nr:hypothetical protein [Trueperaceae bacterium]